MSFRMAFFGEDALDGLDGLDEVETPDLVQIADVQETERRSGREAVARGEEASSVKVLGRSVEAAGHTVWA
jgi:hypothetical protein